MRLEWLQPRLLGQLSGCGGMRRQIPLLPLTQLSSEPQSRAERRQTDANSSYRHDGDGTGQANIRFFMQRSLKHGLAPPRAPLLPRLNREDAQRASNFYRGPATAAAARAATKRPTTRLRKVRAALQAPSNAH